MQPERTPGPCDLVGHDLVHELLDGGERISCARPGCDLDIAAPTRARCLSTAYRTWNGLQGLLDGTERG